MLFYLSLLKSHLSVLNVFYYITFRALGAAVTAFLLSLIFGRVVIRKLISLKFGQPVRTREEVRQLFELHGSKQGTPTMGGVLIIGTVVCATLLWANLENPMVWIALFTILYLGGLGFIDDYLKVTKKKSAGIRSRTKFLCQCALAVLFVAYFFFGQHNSALAHQLFIPFRKGPLIQNMHMFALLFYAAVIVGCSNAVNLTDGLDGLAIGCTITVALTYSILTYAAGNIKIATYLDLPFSPGCGELAIMCLAMVGAGLGFLWFNAHPAQVFMGDTGSLAIGGFIATVAIFCKQEILLVLVGGIFVLEALSVIIQVASFKLTGKRVFAMSPLHHHFELIGWKENTVIVRFWIISIIFAVLGLATLKLR